MFALAGVRLVTIYTRAPGGVMAASDSQDYENSALALLDKGRFAVSPDQPDEPQIRRTPGYPLFIASIYATLARKRTAIIDAQALLATLIIPMVFFLGLKRWGRAGGWAAAIICALDPLAFIYSGMLLSETLFTILLMAALLAASNAIEEEHAQEWSFAAGLLLALATLVRPIAFFLVIPLVVWLAAIRRRRDGDGAAAWVIIAAVLPWFFLVGGWQVRNYAAVGRPVLSTIGELNRFDYRAAGVVALREGIPIAEARLKLREDAPTGVSPAEFDRWMGEEGTRILLENKFTAIGMEIMGGIKLLFGPPQSALVEHLVKTFGNFGSLDWMARTATSAETWGWLTAHPRELFLTLYAELHAIALYILLLIVLYLICKRPGLRMPAIDALIWGTIVYFIIISAGPEANPRFRVPIVPAMAILSAGIVKIRMKGEE